MFSISWNNIVGGCTLVVFCFDFWLCEDRSQSGMGVGSVRVNPQCSSAVATVVVGVKVGLPVAGPVAGSMQQEQSQWSSQAAPSNSTPSCRHIGPCRVLCRACVTHNPLLSALLQQLLHPWALHKSFDLTLFCLLLLQMSY